MSPIELGGLKQRLSMWLEQVSSGKNRPAQFGREGQVLDIISIKMRFDSAARSSASDRDSNVSCFPFVPVRRAFMR
jgi:hypothetical protein